MKKFILALAALALSAQLAFAQNVTVPSTGNFYVGCGTASASGGAATLANKCGVITTESLSTAAASAYTLTLTNTVITNTDLILWSVENGTNTGGDAGPGRATPGGGSATFTVKNNCLLGGAGDCGTAFNGTLKIRFMVLKP